MPEVTEEIQVKFQRRISKVAIAGLFVLYCLPALSQDYDPYPPNILPENLVAEIERVRGEVRVAFERALAEWKALGPIARKSNPPDISGNGYSAVALLGELMNYDESISVRGNQACAFCHMPYVGFGGSIPSVNLTMSAYPGSVHFRSVDRTPMRYTYAPHFPVLQYNETQQDFYGGNFWDGRSTGYQLQNPNAEQASEPLVSEGEMGFPDLACVAYRLSQAQYRPLFEAIWGEASFDIEWPDETEQVCTTPAGAAELGKSVSPVQISSKDRVLANKILNHWGQSLSFYQSTTDVSAFSSKFDAYLAGDYDLTTDEKAGYDLFRGRGNCNSCHLVGTSTLLKTGETDTGAPSDVAPLFTDFTYVNIGLPLNPRLPEFYETQADATGYVGNPDGFGHRDLGMGGFLRSLKGINPNADWLRYAPSFDGAMQTVSARNVAMTPPQCPTTEAGRLDKNGNPIPYFQKAFFHNGYVKSIKQLVHFYNTRDTYAYDVTSGNCPEGTTERVDCWPKPEIPNNVDTTIGDLGLTDQEEDQIVAFLETLTDGFTTPFPNRDIYAGACQTGGSAATQGNEMLIATPELPACPAELCAVAPVPDPPLR